MELTDEQRDVVSCIARDAQPGLLVVNSAPGSGKTTVAIAAVVEHTKTRPKDSVLVVTFSKSAERDIGQRMAAQGVPLRSRPLFTAGAARVCVCTVHAAGYALLAAGLGRDVAYDDARWAAGVDDDEAQREVLVPAILEAMGFLGTDLEAAVRERAPPDAAAALVAKARAHLDGMERAAKRVAPSLLRGGAPEPPLVLPFAAQTYLPAKLGLRSPVPYDLVVVDEFQDLQPIDIQLCLLFAPRRLVLVGDRNQSIYHWRGARCDEVQRLAAEAVPPRRDLALSRSFRCPVVVAVTAAKLVGSVVVGRNDPLGYVRTATLDTWARSVCRGESCLMARKWSKLRRAVDALSRLGVPFVLDGLRYNRGATVLSVSEASHMLPLLRCPRRLGHIRRAATDSEDTDGGRRVVWYDLLVCAANNYGRRLDRVYREDGDDVKLSTVHQMKGREVPHAAFWYDESDEAANGPDDLNILYTAITRARVGFTFVR